MKYDNKQIKDICEFIGGSQPPKSEFIHEPKEGYVRLIQIRDRLNDKFITYIPEKSTSKFCEPDDILIGRYGPPIFQIFRGFKGAYNVAIMKANPINGVNKDYLYYFLLQNGILKYVESMSARTAGQTGVELDSLYEYPVLLPDLDGQEKIASVLKCFDDKIKSNNAINAELEAMAKTIYDYWFLQFEFPDENGKPYKSSGGKMVWNEELKRDIPDGWEVKGIFDIADVTYGFPLSTECFSNFEGLPVIRIRDIPDNSISAYTSEKVDEKYLTKTKDLLIGMDGNFHMNFWSRKGDCVNQRIVRVRTSQTVSVLQIYFEIMPFIKAKEQNTARSTVGHLSDKDMNEIRILVPNSNRFYNIFDDILSKICLNKNENQELASLRDFLLPLLMNGQVVFKEDN